MGEVRPPKAMTGVFRVFPIGAMVDMERGASVKLRIPTTADDIGYSYPLHMLGSISTLPAEEQNDAVAKLHQVVREVTGKPRMGFLP